jgi:hypothetical protein
MKSIESEMKQKKSENIVVPDGGFAWFIVIAYGIANVSFLKFHFIYVIFYHHERELIIISINVWKIIQFSYLFSSMFIIINKLRFLSFPSSRVLD